MKNKFLISVSVLAFMATADSAMAQDQNRPVRVGFGMDIGIPSGAALGVVVHPKLDWVSAEASFTYALAPGGRLSLQLDPVEALWHNFPVGCFADVQGGFAGQGSIPGHTDLPSVGYDYFNLYGGIRLGKPNGFHWNFELGPSYVHVATGNFQSVVSNTGASGLSIGNPVVNGWLVPTFATGFQVVFP